MRVGALPGPQEHAGQGDTRPPRSYHTRPLGPRNATCPSCGKLGRRKATQARRVRTLAYKALTQQSTLMSLLGQGPSRRDRAVVAAPRANYDHDQYRRPTLP